jgi:hypothetical protein
LTLSAALEMMSPPVAMEPVKEIGSQLGQA